jgi:hypothetical protein
MFGLSSSSDNSSALFRSETKTVNFESLLKPTDTTHGNLKYVETINTNKRIEFSNFTTAKLSVRLVVKLLNSLLHKFLDVTTSCIQGLQCGNIFTMMCFAQLAQLFSGFCCDFTRPKVIYIPQDGNFFFF